MRVTWFLMVAVAIALGTATSAHAIMYTWTGGTSVDWTNSANWDANGLPAENTRGVTGAGNTITVQNGTFLPTANVPTFNGGSGGTPRFVIESGAALTINQANGGWDGPAGAGTVVTVNSGGSLTWGNDDSNNTISMMRDPNGTQTFDIGGTFTISTNRLDWGYNQNRFGVFNLDGGEFVFTGTQMYGTRFGASSDVYDDTRRSLVTLDNGSTFSATGATFQGNMEDPDGDPTLVFDILDSGSSVTAKFGNFFNDSAAVEAGLGTHFTSSTSGELVSTDNGNGTFTVGVSAAVPEPSTFALAALGLLGLGWYGRRRRKRAA